MNSGKRFENNFKESVPKGVFFYRFRDGTSSWDSNESTRFQASNICDCMIFNGSLFLLELKNHKGKSIPFTCIRENQINELVKAQHCGVKAGFVFNFQDLEEAYFIDAYTINDYMVDNERKSFPYIWCEQMGVKLENKKLRTNYRYDLNKMLSR